MNLNIWDIMAPAFFECLILVGIHSYLGIHVIKRKVIFVDLALAQVAALGTTVGFLFGVIPGTSGSYWFSLAFAILGAAIFSLSRFRLEKIPQEAVIGLVYALAAAVSILVIDKAPHGAEHIKELLTGSILWVKWSTIIKAALVYAGIGLFHYLFRGKFLLISNNPEAAYEKGLSVRFWDFLFYVSFGVVITHSVGTAGVLLVFVFLVVPAIASILITDVLWKQLLIGWGMGLVVSVAGLYISYIADLPSGPTVVAFYGVMLLLVALFLFVLRSENRKRALAKIALGLVSVAAVVFVLKIMGNFFGHDEHARQDIHTLSEACDSVSIGHSPGGNASATFDAEEFSSINDLQRLSELYQDPALEITDRLKVARRMAQINPAVGAQVLIELLRHCEFPFLREEIISGIEKLSHDRFGYNPEKSSGENAPALRRMERWKDSLARTKGKINARIFMTPGRVIDK